MVLTSWSMAKVKALAEVVEVEAQRF